VATRIVESVPDMDAKFYAATQAMDEARHVELYQRFVRDKIGMYYPINEDLARLLADALNDSHPALACARASPVLLTSTRTPP